MSTTPRTDESRRTDSGETEPLLDEMEMLERELAGTERLRSDRRRLRAELILAENWVEHHSKHADDLIAENVKLRADLERFTRHGLLDCHAICDQRDAAVARAERAEAERDALRAAMKP